MKIKRLSLYSNLHFDLKSALGGAPLDAARKKIIGDNPPIFFTGLFFGIRSKHYSKGPVPMGPAMAQVSCCYARSLPRTYILILGRNMRV